MLEFQTVSAEISTRQKMDNRCPVVLEMSDRTILTLVVDSIRSDNRCPVVLKMSDRIILTLVVESVRPDNRGPIVLE